MVASREDTNGVSQHAPFLGDYWEENENARPNRARYEIVLAVGDEPQDGFERSVSGRPERENPEGGGEQPEVNLRHSSACKSEREYVSANSRPE